MAKNKELRINAAAELRAVGEGKTKAIEGYAAKYGTRSHEMLDRRTGRAFIETIARGAFKKILRSNPDVCCLVGHDDSRLLGRTTSGTLSLSEDNVGLRFYCELPDTTLARDTHTSIQRGDISGCSFAFSLDEGDDEWSEDDSRMTVATRNKPYLRTLRNFSELSDVSVVVHPAYDDTDVQARKRAAEGHPTTHIEQVEQYARLFREIHGI